MTTHKCPRCGKETVQTKVIPLSGTSRCAEVCPACYTYLMESDTAYERFVVLERANRIALGVVEKFALGEAV